MTFFLFKSKFLKNRSLNIFIYKFFQTKNFKSFVPFFYLTIQNEKIENEKIFKHHHFLFFGLTIQKWKNFKHHLFLFFVLLFKKYFGKWKFSFSIFENYKSSQVYKNANFHIGTCKQWNNNTDWLDHILSVGFLRLWKQRRIVFFWDCPPHYSEPQWHLKLLEWGKFSGSH